MPSRNIAVQRGVYEALGREKRAGESFTGVIRRLLEQKRGVEDLVGGWGTARRTSDRQALVRLRGPGGAR